MARKKLTPEEMLKEILEGVDIIGTMLDRELPRLRAELDGYTTDATRRNSGSEHQGSDPSPELATALAEIRELLEMQERRLTALDQRISRLTEAIAAPESERKR